MGKRKYVYFLLLVLVLLFNYAIVLADGGLGDLRKKQKSTNQEMNKKKEEIKGLKKTNHGYFHSNRRVR